MGTSAVTFDPATIKPIEGAETVPSITPQAQALAGAVSFAAQQSPDHWAKLLKFQQVTGIPPVVSKGNEEMVKQAVDAQSIDPHYLTTIAPNVSNWASNPDNAAVSGVDEIHRLSGIEQNAFVMRAHTPSWIETSNDYIRRGVQALTGKTTDQMQADLYQNPLTRGAIDIVGGTAGMIGNIGSMFGIHGSDGKKNLLQRVEEGLSPEENTDPASLFHKSNEFDWLAKNVAPMIPAMLVSGGTAGLASAMKISPTAAKVLSGLAVGGAFTADQGGKTYTQVKESGGSDYQARLSANRVAAINAIPNALFGATDVVSFLRDNPMLTSFGIGGLTGASGQISQNVVTGKSTFEGVGAAALQGAAMQGGMHLGTEAFFGNLSQAVDAAATSKLRERSPEKFKEALSQVFQGDESLRIPADQFAEYFKAQGQKPSEVAASIGASNYAEALLSGGDVEIPKADFIGKLDPDHQKALLPDVVDPSTGVTARQTQQGREELQQWVSGGGPETMVADAAQADAETAMSPEVQSLKTDIQQRYEAAGESPEVAATLAEKDANVYANIAKSANLKPSELLAMYNPKVSVGEAPTGEVLNQSVFHGSPYKFDKFTLDHLGTGEGNQSYGHGLYFAGDREVADYYRQRLGKGATITERGRNDYVVTSPEGEVVAEGLLHGSAQRVKEAFDKNKGQLYEADIPSDDTMLHWDKSLEDQPEFVRKALEKVYPDADPESDDYDSSEQGQSIYTRLSSMFGSAKAASDALHEAGVEGIKYLDGDSRSDGKGTHNYVVFNDQKVSIAKTYYQNAPEGTRGWFKVNPDGSYEIGRTKIGDFSTFAHESAHAYLHVLGDLAGKEGASDTLKADHSKILDWLRADEPKQSPIVRYRKIAAEIENRAPSIVSGDTRLWRGNRPDEVGKASAFTNDLAGIALPFRESYGGDLSYVDVPTVDLGTYENMQGVAKGAEFHLPEDIAAQAKKIDHNVSLPLTVEQQEKWARANELYLREGKAPSSSLRGAFQRFGVWLQSVYRKASDLGVELSDDIRGVLDRMYAAETGVDRAASEAGPRMFTSAEEAGWTEDQFKTYADANDVSVEQAKEFILAKLNEARVRDSSDAWREEEKNVRAAVTAEIDQKPEYAAIRQLRKGKMDDGTDLAINKDAFVKQFGEERAKALHKQHPGMYRAEGGVEPEVAAEMLGFSSGEAMVKGIEDSPRRSIAIEDSTRAYMTAKHGDIRYDGTLPDQARLALENDKRADSLHRELAALKKKLATVKEGEAAKKSAMRDISVAPISAYREAAAQMIEGKAIADIQPTRYLDASRKYSREAFDALRKGDAEEAANAKHKELLNHFLFREATKAKEFVSKFEAFSKKFDRKGVRERIAKAGGVDGQRVYLDQIDGLRGLFGLTEPIADPAQMRQGFTDFANFQQQRAVERFDALNPTWAEDHPGESPDIPQMVDTAILDSAKNYRNLNVAQLRMLNDTLKNVEALAKNDFGAIRDGRRVSFADEVVAFQSQSRGALKEKPVPRSGTDFSTAENIGRTVQGLDAYMQKMEWLIDALDGGDVDGPARRNIKRPIDEANAKSLQMGDEIYKKLGEVIDARPKEDVRDLNELTGVQFPYFDRPLTRKQLISWALNLGTEENQKVALLGEGLINADGSFHPEYDKALKSIRASEWKMVQGVWDTLDGMLPAIREKALRETGIEPKLKAVRSFDVTTESGEVVKLQGGYYPLKGEPGDRVGMLQNEPVASRRPTTSNSHLQTVTGATYRLQMNYDSVLSRHLADVIADTTKGEAVAQVHKFISNDEVRTTLRETLGEKYEPEFMKWLQDFVSEGRGAAQDSSPLLDFMLSRKSGMVAARLGGNLGSYLVQFGDVFKSLADPDVKTKYLAKAFIDIRTSPTETIAQIRDMSPNEMRFREKNFNREIRDMLVSKGLFDQKKQAVTEFLMEGFQVMDKLITFPAWLGRYRQGIAEHGDNGRAIREADRAIARGYQSGDNRNMSRMMRQGGWARLFTTFQGDSNTWYGILSSSVRSADPQRISVAVMALVMEQIVGQYIRNRGPQEDENKAGWALEQTLIAGVGKVPIMGDVAQYAMSKLTGHYASLQNPTSSTLEKMASSPASVYKFTQGEKDGEEAAQDVMEATGLFLGVPGTSQAIRTWKYVHNIKTGKQAAPDNAAEAARAAVFGANSKK